ncbi:MAG: arginine--tRNA ligase [Ruminococcaceae bacterium]|nr:arginine--tRNA ligase [Oscillospiraceae bacterium]
MESVIKHLTNKVSDAFEKCGYERRLGQVSVSDRFDLCQFQCNGSFEGAKLYKKAPLMIAEQIAEILRQDSEFKAVDAVRPGFINITLTDEFLTRAANEVLSDENLGIPTPGIGETMVIDYGGANVAKPLHIGHLRAAIIGESLKRIARTLGYNVVGDVHMGDWGLQIGLVIAELNERHPEWCCFKEDFDPETEKVPELNVDDLNEIYPFASKKSKENEEFAEKAHKITAELQKGKPGYIAVWKEIMRVSVADLKLNYGRLNVDFDLWYGESDAEKYVDELVEILKNKDLLRESEGAQVVDVAEEGDKIDIPPVIIKKSDNSNIYATTDLATIIQREKDFKPSKIWYVVDKRQSLHFTQVFRCAKKAGIVPETTELEHLGFGTMNGSDGKPYKTRDGGVMRLSDLLTTVTEAAEAKMKESEFVSAEERKATAEKVGIAAVKFGDLINHRTKDYIFDIDKFLSFEGKTGTYLLYTVTRINSVLKKTEGANANEITGIYSDTERELILNLILSGEAFVRSFNEKAPNYVCDNAYKLASLFSGFYHDNHIINEEDETKKASWITLCNLTRKMLLKHFDVLAIDSVESM